MKLEFRELASLLPYARNARKHSDVQLQQLAASMIEYGWTNPVLVDDAGTIVAGHGRCLAAELVWSGGKAIPGCAKGKAPCISLGKLSDARRRAYVLADNKIALNSTWDQELLRSELLALGESDLDLGLTGFTADEIAQAMIWQPPVAARKADPDAVPEVKPEAVTQLGNLWCLGRHRLYCGDSTKRESLQAATCGAPGACVWTDPPYNVDRAGVNAALDSMDGGNRASSGKIANDSMDAAAFATFLTAVFTACEAALAPGAAIYVAHSDLQGLTFRAAFVAAGLKLSGCLIWRKNGMVVGRSDYQWQHESILYGWKRGGKHHWYGGRKQTTIVELASAGATDFTQLPGGKWQVRIGDRVLVITGDAKVEEFAPSVMTEDRPKASADHPTMKPVALIERMLKNSARAGDLVLDPFGGSGSTLIAAERLGMTAALVELEPRFCDVIVRRWQQFTGKTATLERAGHSFDDVAKGGAGVIDGSERAKANGDHPKAGNRKPRKAAAKSKGTDTGAGAAVGTAAPVG